MTIHCQLYDRSEAELKEIHFLFCIEYDSFRVHENLKKENELNELLLSRKSDSIKKEKIKW